MIEQYLSHAHIVLMYSLNINLVTNSNMPLPRKFFVGEKVKCSQFPGKICEISSVSWEGDKTIFQISFRTDEDIVTETVPTESLSLGNPIDEIARLSGHYPVSNESSLADLTGIPEISKFKPFKDSDRKLAGVMLKSPAGSFEIAVKTGFWTQMYGYTLQNGVEDWKQNFGWVTGRHALLFDFVEKTIKTPVGHEATPVEHTAVPRIAYSWE